MPTPNCIGKNAITSLGIWIFCQTMDIGTKWRGRARFPKFKFSAKFPIGLHVTLQMQINKLKKMPDILCAKLFLKENLAEFKVELFLK